MISTHQIYVEMRDVEITSRLEEDGSVKNLINFNKGKYDDRCLKFCNILKWGATL
jgi:hypothetical protein